MPIATKFWLLFPAIALLVLSVILYVLWPFRTPPTERSEPVDDERLRPLRHRGEDRR